MPKIKNVQLQSDKFVEQINRNCVKEMNNNCLLYDRLQFECVLLGVKCEREKGEHVHSATLPPCDGKRKVHRIESVL